MDWLHVYIAGAAFLVFALVGMVLLLSSQQVKFDLNQGIFTYLKFIYASFLKPHDNKVEDQQGALESFYKAQVREEDTGDCGECSYGPGQRLRCHPPTSPLRS